jgi:malate/lactate dehydrogenase
MATIAIFGAGDVGGSCAHALAAADRIDHIVVIDAAANVAAGKALDIQQSIAISGSHARVEGTADESRAIGCRVCVIADGFAPGSPEWQGEAGLALVKRIAALVDDVPIVFAGVSHADLIAAVVQEARVPAKLLIGSATEALASAATAIAAMEAGCSPSEVALAVLGTPPRSFVVPWSDASIGGFALERVISQVQLRRIEARVARLWPPGPYTLGAAAAEAVDAILSESRRSMNILTMLGGEFGARGSVGAVPALLGPRGIAQTRVPSLNTRERVLLETALGI